MFVIITGGGRTGAQLASTLVAQGHQVRLIEHRRDLLTRIHHELPTEVIYEGVATDPAIPSPILRVIFFTVSSLSPNATSK